MAEAILPPWVRPVSPVNIRSIDDMTDIFQPKYGRARGQRQIWGDPRWGVQLKFQGMRADERAALSRLAELRGKGGTIRFCPGLPQRGSFPAVELISNGQMASGTTNWTSGNSGITVVSASERVLRGTRVAIGDTTIQAPVATVVSGVAYVARGFVYKGRGPATESGTIRLGTTAGAADYGSASVTPLGALVTLGMLASGTSMYFSFTDVDDAGKAIGDFTEFPYASLSRCPLVNGASQVGGGLIVDKLPASTNDLLLPGDFFEIGGEIKKVTAPLNSDASGNGYINFRPALAASPADNDPVVILNPYGRFMLADDIDTTENFGIYTDADFSMLEVYE